MYTYFVSFYAEDDYRPSSVGNIVIKRQNRIDSTEEIRSVEKLIQDEANIETVFVISFQLLKEERKPRIENYIGIRFEE